MDLWLSIILIVGPVVLATYLSIVKRIGKRTKIIVWVICSLICFCGGYGVLKEKKGEEQKARLEEYYHQLQERQELRSRGLPIDYIGGLGKNPLLKHSFNMGQRYKKESKFEKAIEEFQECLSHPKAAEEDKVAANILIGNCYYMLSKLKEAEKQYEGALNISKRVKDKSERLPGRAAALGNIGVVYSGLGKPDEALKYHEEALEIYRKVGYEQGIANQLGNIGTVYSGLGESDEALRYFEEALEIHKKIGYEKGIANQLGNIGLIYSDLGKPGQALKYLEEALEMFKRVGAQPEMEIVSERISTIKEEKRRRIQ